MKYVKKPTEIEAFQWDIARSSNYEAYFAGFKPMWALDALLEKKLCIENGELYVQTLEGKLHVSKGDYLIRGVEGELYPVRADIFKKTYIPVQEPVFGYCPYCGKEMEAVSDGK